MKNLILTTAALAVTAGFAFADGTDMRLIRDWQGDGPEAAFLRAARDGAFPKPRRITLPDPAAARQIGVKLWPTLAFATDTLAGLKRIEKTLLQALRPD